MIHGPSIALPRPVFGPRTKSRGRPGKLGSNRKDLTAFQKLCRSFLIGYGGYSASRLDKLTGAQIAEAARLICIRDGHKDWIGYISDWWDRQQK